MDGKTALANCLLMSSKFCKVRKGTHAQGSLLAATLFVCISRRASASGAWNAGSCASDKHFTAVLMFSRTSPHRPEQCYAQATNQATHFHVSFGDPGHFRAQALNVFTSFKFGKKR